jgi:Na+/phosphate symporter
VAFTTAQQEELLALHDRIDAYYDRVDAGLENHSASYLNEIRAASREITNEIRELRDRHWNRLSEETVEPLISTSYMDVANSYRRMKDHLLNIGEAAVGGKTVREDRFAEPTFQD